MNNNRIICIIGKSGSGKTTVVKELERQGFNIIHSYTTRPMREDNEWGHTFVDAPFCFDDNYQLNINVIAYTFFNNYHYWAGREQIKDASIYVIDPKGVEYLRERVKDIPIETVYFKCCERILVERMCSRGDSQQNIEQRISHDRLAFKDYEIISDNIVNCERDLKDVIEEVKFIIDKTS
ncbi:AAA family ATPase [Clostridium estertheticum]|uniref:AAA family ATPase n=1 Tax=Clostridium estertheticum TaxID=238834 RepID=UPI0013E947F9|nr:AAA family ATPase [Clostridium estertheticum]MBZ9689788.1 AAA family ATPase [Clostridium estertheticum]